jgi:endo-1,4-beta-xylanase
VAAPDDENVGFAHRDTPSRKLAEELHFFGSAAELSVRAAGAAGVARKWLLVSLPSERRPVRNQRRGAVMKNDGKTSRREFVAGVAAGGIVSAFGSAWPAYGQEWRSLNSLAAEKGILFGSAVGAGKAGTPGGSLSDPGYVDILKKECGVLVPENEFKSYVIAAERGKYDFTRGDRIAAFANSHGMKLRGHTLLWNKVKYMPRWLLDAGAGWSAADAEKYLRDYIRQVCAHYGDAILSWDVVNETVDEKTGEIRETPFTRVLGFDALRIAFEAAREHAPRAQLVYNDYMGWEAGNDNHRAGVLRLLEQFKAKNIPVQALGIQSHLGNDGHLQQAQRQQWQAFVEAVVGMGYRLLITEFDVNDRDLPGDFATRDAQVAATAREYLDLMLSYRQLDQLLCWGMVDKFSWLQQFSKRADHIPQRCTPYDDSYRAKPLREALAAAFSAAPQRSAGRS